MWATESEHEDEPVPISGESQEAYGTGAGAHQRPAGRIQQLKQGDGERAFDPHRRAGASGGVSVGDV